MDKLRQRGYTDIVTFRRKDYDITREDGGRAAVRAR